MKTVLIPAVCFGTAFIFYKIFSYHRRMKEQQEIINKQQEFANQQQVFIKNQEKLIEEIFKK